MRIALCVALLATLPSRSIAEPCESISIWRDGHRDGAVCRADAAARGFTVLDLRDDWVPPVLDGGPTYRDTYVALAQERFADAGLDGQLAARDRYLELFGIEPTLSVVRARLADRWRHFCHDAIDDTALAAQTARIAEEARTAALSRLTATATLRAELEHDRDGKHLADLDELAASDAYFRRAVDRLTSAETRIGAIHAAQAHLACDELFAFTPIEAAYTWQTADALESFQRGAMILPSGVLDDQTRDALLLDSRERDFRTALRALRGRVVAATGLIEDGTAGNGQARVLDRELEPERTWRVRGHDPLDGAAPDLVSAATEAAARALGWRDPASTLAFLVESPRLVAVALPKPPAYHAPTMTLSIEIDRGDVWHDPTPRWRDAARRPALIVYAHDGERRIPLARWPTTIGGWQNEELAGGDIEKEWKESPVGHRVWRDIYVGPSWLAPMTTPDRELVRSADDHYVLAREQFGPSYRAAFGLVEFVHVAEERVRGRVSYADEGIRTHGTGNLVSLAHGVSHGCHRILGEHAVRLADFLLAHVETIRHGDQPTYYRRVVRYRGRFPIAIDSLGYRIELVTPIPVDVLPGRVHR